MRLAGEHTIPHHESGRRYPLFPWLESICPLREWEPDRGWGLWPHNTYFQLPLYKPYPLNFRLILPHAKIPIFCYLHSFPAIFFSMKKSSFYPRIIKNEGHQRYFKPYPTKLRHPIASSRIFAVIRARLRFSTKRLSFQKPRLQFVPDMKRFCYLCTTY